MTALVLLSSASSPFVWVAAFISAFVLAAALFGQRQSVVALVLACACAAAFVATDTPPAPKPDAPIYCPCSLALCLLGACIPAHAHDTTAMTPWMHR